MNIYDAFPEAVDFDGETLPLNLAFDNVLRALDAGEDEGLSRADRIEAQCLILLRDVTQCPRDYRNQLRLLAAIFELFPKSEGEKSTERALDFHQDAAMIRSGFMRIGIDLTKQHIHFFQFLELLNDLPSDTALMRTVDIRLKPLPKPTKSNSEYIAALQKAKDRCAIKLSAEERRRNFAKSLKNSTILRG